MHVRHGQLSLSEHWTQSEDVARIVDDNSLATRRRTCNLCLRGSIFIAGAAVQWLRDGLGIIPNTAESEILAASLQSNDGVYFCPGICGMGSPWWNSDVRGTITGLTRGTGKAHIARAALESIAYQVRDVAHDMANSGLEICELRVDGGASKNKFLLQFQADLLCAPVIRSAQAEATAWGVAALAGLRFGLFESKEQIERLWSYDLTVDPKNDRDQDYAGWQKALKGAFACSGVRW